MTNNYVDLSICLSDIDKNRIYTGKDGKKYLYCEVHERREVDQFGNSHYVSMSIKDENGKYNTVYIGKGKAKTFAQAQAQQTAAPAPAKPAPTQEESQDLPF